MSHNSNPILIRFPKLIAAAVRDPFREGSVLEAGDESIVVISFSPLLLLSFEGVDNDGSLSSSLTSEEEFVLVVGNGLSVISSTFSSTLSFWPFSQGG